MHGNCQQHGTFKLCCPNTNSCAGTAATTTVMVRCLSSLFCWFKPQRSCSANSCTCLAPCPAARFQQQSFFFFLPPFLAFFVVTFMLGSTTTPGASVVVTGAVVAIVVAATASVAVGAMFAG